MTYSVSLPYVFVSLKTPPTLPQLALRN
uniref:Uncharacterized protein n=1 Tax=Nelumbo nucifera TaxID=4432 RepID=A0A822XRW7_NELNU|nr:TPA_asm: hypothetical protein HUJ06_022998 [Nelumbo nucifera]